MYRVIKYFTDLHDDGHPYHEGDEFPRKGINVTDERLKELSGKDNKQGVPLIEAVEKEEPAEEKNAAPAKKTVVKSAVKAAETSAQ